MAPVKCPKCYKMIKTNQRLQVHLAKKNPCDKVCPICHLKLPNQRAYHSHRKEHVAKLLNEEAHDDEEIEKEIDEEKTKDEVIELKPICKGVTMADLEPLDISVTRKQKHIMSPVMILKELFALEDFSVESVSAERELITSSKDKIVLEKVSYERTTLRGKDIERYLQPILMMISLGVLGHKADIQFIMQQVMYYVHAQESQPQFHSLCRTDFNRNIISMYSRPHPEGESNWIRAPFKDSLSRLNHHARNLTLFVVHAGMKALQAQYWKPKGHVVLRMHDESNEAILFRVNNKLFHKRQQLTNTDDFIACQEEHIEEANALIRLVNERKIPALSAIDAQTIDTNSWNLFFNFSRLICLPTVKQTQ